MGKRVRLKEPEPDTDEDQGGNIYFTSNKEKLDFVSTGCTLLDCALSGGPVLGRMINVVGDKSTAKTALATEMLTNFHMRYPEGYMAYKETEGAYDMDYAEAMGAPVGDIDFGKKPITTAEGFARDLEAFAEKCYDKDIPGMYALDSFDSLSDEAEMERNFGDASYGMQKAKVASEMFRKLTKLCERARVSTCIVSQVRENINVTFGEKYRRAGGKALDFYATHILWLAHKGQLKRTIKGVERVYGIEIKANVKKNKIGFPFRQCEFDFLFGYGIDDLTASIDWLKGIKRLGEAELPSSPEKLKAYMKELDKLDNRDYRDETKRIAKVVKRVWNEIEYDFLPKRSKYG